MAGVFIRVLIAHPSLAWTLQHSTSTSSGRGFERAMPAPHVTWCAKSRAVSAFVRPKPLLEPPMCQPVPCPTCAKTTWSGCGEHVEAVKAEVAPGNWCVCE